MKRNNEQIGQMPLLDRLLLKNPLFLRLSRWGLVDSTSPVARFARSRMAERLAPIPEAEPGLPGPSPRPSRPRPPANSSTGEKETQPPPPPPPGPDLLSKFIAAKEERPDLMTDTLVQTMAVSMAFAGSETTAISLSSVVYHLLRNRSCYRKLQAEVDDACAAGGPGRFSVDDDDAGVVVTFAEAQQLPYLHACVQEAFRLHPAPGLPLERVVPAGGAEIAGHHVPGGTIVGCSPWVIHRRPEVFGPDADEYRPERWLPCPGRDAEDESRRIKRMASTMLHFGMGSRTCIGKNISLLEIYKLVPSLLRKFNVSLLCIHRFLTRHRKH